MSSSCATACYADNLKVLRDLTGNLNYSTAINPSTGTGGPLYISVGFILVKLLELSNGGTFSMVAALNMVWIDSGLTWTVADYNGITVIEIPPTSIWTPKLTLVNGASENLNINIDNRSVASVTSEGFVMLSIAGQFKGTCPMDLTFFPFDSQKCTLQFGLIDLRQTYTSVNFSVSPLESQLATYMYTSGGEFSLNQVSLITAYTGSPLGMFFPYFNVTVSFSRNPNYYINNVAIPSILLLVAAGMVFLIPSDNSVKIAMACSLMVALYVLQQAVGRMLPATKTTPLLATGMIFELWLGGYSLISAVVTVSLRSWQPALSPGCLKVVKLFEFITCSDHKSIPKSNQVVPMTIFSKREVDHRVKEFLASLAEKPDPCRSGCYAAASSCYA